MLIAAGQNVNIHKMLILVNNFQLNLNEDMAMFNSHKQLLFFAAFVLSWTIFPKGR